MKNKYWIIGLYQLIGGGAGLTYHFLEFMAIPAGSEGFRNYFLLVLGFAFFLYSILSGFYLFYQQESGIRMSRICQGLQVLSISVFGFKYTFYTGIIGGFIVSLSDNFYFSPMYNVGTEFYCYILPGSEQFTIGANLLSLLLVMYLYGNPFTGEKETLDKHMQQLDMDQALQQKRGKTRKRAEK